MTDTPLERHIQDLERLIDLAGPETRTKLRRDVEMLINTLKKEDRRSPKVVRRLERLLARDLEEDFFDNMPV